MKKAIALLLSVSFVLLTACSSNQANPAENTDAPVSETVVSDELPVETEAEEIETELIKNGTFDMNTSYWDKYLSGGFSSPPSVEDGALHIGITSVGQVEYGVQLFQDGIPLYNGGKYKCTFDMRSDVPRRFEFRFQKNGGDYQAYYDEWISITNEMTTYTVEFTMDAPTDEYARIVFNLGNPMDGQELDIHHIYLDNVKLELVDDSSMEKVEKTVAPDIAVDQVGYKTQEQKTAVFRDAAIGENFSVVDAKTDKVVFEGKISEGKENKSAGETDAYGDFSKLTEVGEYYIKTDDSTKSYTFVINDNVYDAVSNDVIKMLYLQRCGSNLPSEYAGDFSHPACHTDKATVYETGEKIDVTGGWHDAGDYGRYVVAGAKTVADLLISYNRTPDKYKDDIGIPESNNGVPDILDEARYELDWMLKMQTSSGGVYHKVTVKDFPGDIMPQDEGEQLVSPISSAATADFAAVMAMASESYKTIDKNFSDKCLKAAESAWKYLEQNEFPVYKNIPEITTGTYADSKDSDERYWAAAALYSVTGEKKYRDVIVSYSTKTIDNALGWQGVSGYGSYVYLMSIYAKTDSSTLYPNIEKLFLSEADRIVAASKSDGYFISLGEDYPWGSNMTVANNAMLLIMANDISANSAYIQTAENHLHYLLGRNPMSICYVTGYGTVSPENPHHRPSTVIGKAMTGMLVGGPDGALEDDFAKLTLKGQAPAKCYADNVGSYSTNEITIYWNSPLIFVLGEFR